MKIRVDFSAILAAIIVLYCNGGMLGFFKGSALVTVFIYGALVLWFVWAMIIERDFVAKYVFVVLLVIAFFCLLNLFMFVLNPSTIGLMGRMRKNILFLLMFIAMFVYYSAPTRKPGRKIIIFAWGVDTIMSSIYTIYRLIEIPTLSRILATENPESELGGGISLAGIFGFGSIYGLVFIITAIVGLIPKVKRIYKVFMISCVVLFVYTVVQAQFFIASVLCVLGILMGLFLSNKITVRKIIVVIVLSPLIVLLGYIIVSTVLPALANSGVLPEFISYRLMMFLEGVSIETLLATARGVVYLKSFSSIINSYGIGVMFMNHLSIGGHSEILDLIAIYGVPLATVLIYGICRVKIFISSSIPNDLMRNYNIIWFLYLLMSLFNTSLWCQTTVSVFLIIPLAYIEFGSGQKRGELI